MALDRMFEVVENLRETATADAVFGQPQEVGGRVLIPVAEVGTGFGMGFGQGPAGAREEDDEAPAEGEGGGAGGGAKARPIAVIEVTPEGTQIRSIQDETKVALAGIAMVAWVVFCVTVTIRRIFAPTP